MRDHRGYLVTAAVIAALISTEAARAVTLGPTTLELSGVNGWSGQIRIAATDAGQTALDFSIIERSVVDGAEALVVGGRASDLFVLTPPQLLLDPGEDEHVGVQWTGEREGESSRSFFLVIEELPIAGGRSSSTAQIAVLATYLLPLHVDIGGDAALSAALDTSARSLVLSNLGNRYARLTEHELAWRAPTSDRQGVIDGSALSTAAQAGSVLPGGALVLPLDSLGLPNGVELTFEIRADVSGDGQ